MKNFKVIMPANKREDNILQLMKVLNNILYNINIAGLPETWRKIHQIAIMKI